MNEDIVVKKKNVEEIIKENNKKFTRNFLIYI